MKKISLLCFCLICLSAVSFCQDGDDGPRPPSTNAKNVFGEIGGNGVLLTANYDFRFGQTQRGLGMRVGLGFFGGSNGGIVSIPVAINNLSGRAPNYLEVGFGVTYLGYAGDDVSLFDEDAGGVLLVPSIGYRYQPKGKGITARVALTPLFATSGEFVTWGGLSVGYKF